MSSSQCFTQKIEQVKQHHYEAIRILRNQHKDSFLSDQEIDSETHEKFMNHHAATYRVAINLEGTVVGFIGHVGGDVRLATRKDTMRSGVASFLWERFKLEFEGLTVKVKRDNKRSMAFFENMGWKVDSSQWEAGSDPVPLVIAKGT